MKTIDWKRAVTELIVIILGVMLALAADRWQQARQQEGLAGTYIDRLIADLNTDLKAYQSITEWSTVIDEAAAYGVEDRAAVFVDRLSRGYWNVPAVVLGPDLLPGIWLRVQGRGLGYLPSPGSLELTKSDMDSAVERLRDIENFESLAADVRFFMMQRKIIYEERLPPNAEQLKALLELAQ